MLKFNTKLLQKFQAARIETPQFNFRLVELMAEACHQIAIYLYQLNEGAYKHQLHKDWLDKVRSEPEQVRRKRYYEAPPVAFFHCAYRNSDLYRQGDADVVGFWAEGRIFGGVLWFDRGETEEEV